MDIICVDIMTGEILPLVQLACIGQFVHPVGMELMVQGLWTGWIVILANCEYYFIREHENLVQYPTNNISIYIYVYQRVAIDLKMVDLSQMML